MKKIIFIVYVLSLISVYGQSNFSTRTKMLNNHLQKDLNKSSQEKLIQNYFLYEKNSTTYVNAVIKVNNNFDKSFFKNQNITVRSTIGNLVTVSIPLKQLNVLAEQNGIEYVSIDSRIKTRLESASADTRTPLVHSGYELPYPVTGKGVIVGIIDGGFDYTHPAFFYNEDSLRISRVWEQTLEGNPPAGFSYGNELVGKDEILIAEKSPSAEYESHGTHVAGIAAGSGYLSDGKYTGSAPGSEIVLVEVENGESNLIDAVKYIFDYAESVNKPAVINMSLGSHYGPHDGTSLLDQAFDQLQGPGKILAGAAGNEGDTDMHIMKSSSQDSVRTVAMFLFSGLNPGYNTGDINIWGDQSPFSLRFTVLDTTTKQVRAVSHSASTQNPGFEIIDLYYGSEYVAAIEVSTDDGSFNGNHNAYIYADVKQGYYLAISLSGTGNIHAWNLSDIAFSDIDLPQLFSKGDNNFTIGEVGGTGKNVISSGAYSTKNSFINLDGQQLNIPFYTQVGELAGFSSNGPTLDGRIKPDITSPGNAVASSVSSFDMSFTDPIYQQFLVDKSIKENDEWFYAVFQGTSMSSPMTAGIIALMLEANPDLNATQIKNILRKTARQDEFTGTIPIDGSNLWGHGKIDAYTAVYSAFNSTSVDNENYITDSYELYNNFPNPFNPTTAIKFNVPFESRVNASVYNILGEKVTDLLNEVKHTGVYTINWNAENFSSGTYICKVDFNSADGKNNSSKIIKMMLMK